ncbi:hypothetical protein J4216_04380 [Candidatus Woesearchaeota archaeon]|nr:hypothetical protein [Candidatus Woesearchaeota archaeon]
MQWIIEKLRSLIKKEILWGIIILVILFITLALLQYTPEQYSKEYKIVPGYDLLGDFYFSDLKENNLILKDDSSIRIINQSSFILNLESNKDISKAKFEFNIESDSDIYFKSWDDNNKRDYWVKLNHKPLHNYAKVGEFGDIEVYAKKSYINSNFFIPKDANNIYQWLDMNVQEGTTITDYNQQLDWSLFLNNLTDINNSENLLDYSFRFNHNFYVMLNDGLKLRVLKTDTNEYYGEDILNIRLESLNQSLIWESILGDDGIIEISKKINPQNEIIGDANIKTGIYILRFISESSSDLLYSFSINTDKIVVVDNYFAIDKNEIYIKSYEFNNKFKAKIIHDYSKQNLLINKETVIINETSKYYNFSLDNGENLIKIPKGNIKISGFNFASFSKDQYFEPYKYIRSDEGDILIKPKYNIVKFNKEIEDDFIYQIQFKASEPYLIKFYNGTIIVNK